VNFKNLSPGSYTFKVRAKLANSASEKIATYTFTISKPWYATYLALFIYLILIIILARIIHKAYRNYYQKQKEKLIEENNLLLEIKELENEQQLMKTAQRTTFASGGYQKQGTCGVVDESDQ